MLCYCYHWYVVWLGDFYKHLEVALVARIHHLRHSVCVYIYIYIYIPSYTPL
jgi:hypothetical protein